jgi:hypothetical protein
MGEPPPLPQARRYLGWKILLAVILAVLAGAEFYNCVFCCDHDFLWHCGFGNSFLNDRVYARMGQHYLPARAMLDAATCWMPYYLNRTLWFTATCAGLALCVPFWSHVGGHKSRHAATAAALALAVMSTYIHRDLAECGLQLFLLCMLTAGLWALLHNSPSLCGFWLGLATVYKVMPLLFLPYLVWKRQWRAAGWMMLFTGMFCLMPALFLGGAKNQALHQQWLNRTLARLAIEDPSENGVETPALWNRSLPLALARLVQAYPEGHPLHLDNSTGAPLATLNTHAAKRFVQAVLLILAAALAWRFRHAVDLAEGRESVASEWAAVCILVALLSPLCWLHHLVLAIPAALLFAQRAAAGQARRWQWRLAVLAAGMMLLVHRGLLSGSAWNLLSVLSPHTLAGLLLAAAALGRSEPSRTPALVAPVEATPADVFRLRAAA